MKLHWMFWTVLFGVICGAAVYYSVPAHAAVPQPALGVCSDLDTTPTFDGINTAMLSTLAAMNPAGGPANVDAAAVIVVNTVASDCPKYIPLLVKYAKEGQA